MGEEIRKQKALMRLGSDHPCCLICGMDDWRCLELHHISQKRFGDLTGPICRNCHRKLSDMQRDYPEDLNLETPTILEQIGHFLLGLADFLYLLVNSLRSFGKQLIEAASQCPQPWGQLNLEVQL